jgi:hypothetical protein
VISEVRIFPAFAFTRKAPRAPTLTDMSLGSLYRKRDISILPHPFFLGLVRGCCAPSMIERNVASR